MIVINNWFYSHFFLDLNSCQVGLSIQYSDKFVNVMKTVRFNCRSKWYIVKINRLYSKGDKNISYRFTMKIFPSTILASVLKKIFLDTCFRISFKCNVQNTWKYEKSLEIPYLRLPLRNAVLYIYYIKRYYFSQNEKALQ